MRYDGIVQEFSHTVFSLCIHPEIINLSGGSNYSQKGIFCNSFLILQQSGKMFSQCFVLIL